MFKKAPLAKILLGLMMAASVELGTTKAHAGVGPWVFLGSDGLWYFVSSGGSVYAGPDLIAGLNGVGASTVTLTNETAFCALENTASAAYCNAVGIETTTVAVETTVVSTEAAVCGTEVVVAAGGTAGLLTTIAWATGIGAVVIESGVLCYEVYDIGSNLITVCSSDPSAPPNAPVCPVTNSCPPGQTATGTTAQPCATQGSCPAGQISTGNSQSPCITPDQISTFCSQIDPSLSFCGNTPPSIGDGAPLGSY